VEEGREDRDYLLASNSINYPEEEGNYMDFPSYEVFRQRFVEQNVLSEKYIDEAIENTNKILDFEDIVLDRTLKVPVLPQYKNKTQQERNEILKKILVDEWIKQYHDLNLDKLEEYKQEVQNNYNEIVKCDMADYFIDNYYIVKEGIKLGGIITPSGRGSGVSEYINKLLGFTKVDKVNAPVKMYAERFITATRILESKTPPDIDNNITDRAPFLEAQRKLLGYQGNFDLLALGTLKYKSAFKMFARANNLDPQLANEVTKQIDKYEKAIKHMDDDETEDDYNIFDYVDEKKYGHLINGCQKYRGIVDTLKSHPCASIMLDTNAIEDVGVILVKSESTGRECWVALQESSTMDAFGYVKNDWLIVDSIGLTYDIYKELNIEPFTVNQLLEKIEGNQKVWDIYAKGLTMCINQVEKKKSTEKVMRFKPKNIYELTQFVAGIRPSFQSMYKIFESRQHFDYGIKAFDDLLQDEYCDSSFILYQESLMKVLSFAGFPMSETYTIIKAISKKKKYVIDGAKEKFIPNFTKAILNTKETEDEQVAKQMAEKVWTIIESSASYGFNCSHAYCMAIDSVTLAYLKAYYPYEFYKVTLQRYTEKGDKNKVTDLKKEMLKMGIQLKPIKFRDDNRTFSIMEREGEKYISQTMSSIKNMQKFAPSVLYELKDKEYNNFFDVLIDLKSGGINKTSIEILIKLNYFREFGNINKLFFMWQLFNRYYGKKQINKKAMAEYTEFEQEAIKKFSGKECASIYKELDSKALLDYLADHIKLKDLSEEEKACIECKYLGYTDICVSNSPYSVCNGLEVNQYGTTFVSLYDLNNGSTTEYKANRQWVKQYPLQVGDLVRPLFKTKPRMVYNAETKKYDKTGETYEELNSYSYQRTRF
jgi:DNA polymerase III alpha subunit